LFLGTVNGIEPKDIHPFSNIPAGTTETYVLDNDSLALNASEYTNKALRVSCENCSFTLQVFINDNGYIEGFMGIPLERMTGPNEPNHVYEFIAATFCAIGGYCQIAIAADEDSTFVYIKVQF